ncbi:LOW QUALITY PROTEIN: hypothetical protein PanWU01x14_069860 [Parasponia andersonii]|uniref:Transmembrane protein n=1 Tax=Parasponia andersonii TaxID=3476 RepID=A0A2P5DET2_PARAD|nr:LOW QUALITY PROTEIN: hypothetical protein PanWU01x14_069860 [Parasponia andersonii]
MLDHFIVVFSLVLHYMTILIRFYFYVAFLSLCKITAIASFVATALSFLSFFRSVSSDLHKFSQCIYIKFFVLVTTTLILITFLTVLILVLIVLMIFFNVV